MVNETPVNYTEIFQKEIAEMLTVNKDAREQRIAIEDSLKLDPFVDHLYSEGEFEKLIFFEQRRTNDLLTKIVVLLSHAQGVTEIPVCEIGHANIPVNMEPVIEVPPQAPGEITGYENDRPAYAHTSDEPMDPNTGIHQIESDSLSESERATLESDNESRVTANKPPSNAATKKPAGRGRR